jgi:hypothetical protein
LKKCRHCNRWLCDSHCYGPPWERRACPELQRLQGEVDPPSLEDLTRKAREQGTGKGKEPLTTQSMLTNHTCTMHLASRTCLYGALTTQFSAQCSLVAPHCLSMQS